MKQWFDAPVEILEDIFAHLHNPVDRLHASLTCRHWNHVMMSSWLDISIQSNRSLVERNVNAVLAERSRLKQLRIEAPVRHSSVSVASFEAVVQQFQGHPAITKIECENEFILGGARNCPRLESLSVKPFYGSASRIMSDDFPGLGIVSTLLAVPHVRQLEICQAKVWRPRVVEQPRNFAVEELRLTLCTSSAFADLLSTMHVMPHMFPNLRSIHLQMAEPLMPRSITVISKACPQLEQLILEHVQLHPTHVYDICLNLPHLKRIEFHCCQIHFDSISLALSRRDRDMVADLLDEVTDEAFAILGLDGSKKDACCIEVQQCLLRYLKNLSTLILAHCSMHPIPPAERHAVSELQKQLDSLDGFQHSKAEKFGNHLEALTVFGSSASYSWMDALHKFTYLNTLKIELNSSLIEADFWARLLETCPKLSTVELRCQRRLNGPVLRANDNTYLPFVDSDLLKLRETCCLTNITIYDPPTASFFLSSLVVSSRTIRELSLQHMRYGPVWQSINIWSEVIQESFPNLLKLTLQTSSQHCPILLLMNAFLNAHGNAKAKKPMPKLREIHLLRLVCKNMSSSFYENVPEKLFSTSFTADLVRLLGYQAPLLKRFYSAGFSIPLEALNLFPTLWPYLESLSLTGFSASSRFMIQTQDHDQDDDNILLNLTPTVQRILEHIMNQHRFLRHLEIGFSRISSFPVASSEKNLELHAASSRHEFSLLGLSEREWIVGGYLVADFLTQKNDDHDVDEASRLETRTETCEYALNIAPVMKQKYWWVSKFKVHVPRNSIGSQTLDII